MPDREKVMKGLECCLVLGEDMLYRCDECPYRATEDERKVIDWRCHLEELRSDALELMKGQEQEISRLKHHVDCDAAEKLPSGCVGYGRGLNDDEPCETCKACEKYNGYGEE